MDYTSNGLIDKIERWAAIPADQPAFEREDLVKMINEELESIVIPDIMSCNEDFFVKYADFAIPATDTPISLPSDMIVGKIREIKILPSNGDITQAVNITRIDYSVIGQIPVNAFYFAGNKLYLNYPQSNTNSILRIWYYSRPNELVLPEFAAEITGINTLTNTVTVDSVPVTWAAGTKVSLINGTPHFDILSNDYEISSIMANDIIMTSALPTDIKEGDYVALKNESPVVNIPYELQNYLCQAVVVRVLEIIGVDKQFSQALQKMGYMREKLHLLVSPRVRGEPKVINNSMGLF